MATMGGLMFVMTLLLQFGLGLGALRAGVVFLPMGVTSMVASLVGRRLFARHGVRILVAGVVISTLGLLVFAVETQLLAAGTQVLAAGAQRAGAVSGAAWLGLPLGLFGLGSGLLLPPLLGVALAGVRPARVGAASGVLTTTQQFAAAAGVAVLGSVFFTRLGAHPDPREFAAAAGVTAWIDVALAAVSTALVLLLPRPAATPAVPAPPAVKTGV